MRIWIINHYALPPTSAGGTRHYSLARQLIQRGHEVMIVAANYNHFSREYMPHPKEWGRIDHSYDVPITWIPTPAYSGNTIARFWNMLVFSWRILRKKYLPRSLPPDVIIGSSPHIFTPLSALILSKQLKKPFILEIRDIWPDTLVDLGRFTQQHPLIKLMKKIELFLYKKADRIISLLPKANEYLVGHGVLPQHIAWIPNAIDIDSMPVFDTVQSERQHTFTFIYAGAHGLANDLDTVVYAAKILQERGMEEKLHICLIGDGPDKMRLKELARKEDVHMIEFRDSVSKKDIYAELNKADVFLMLLKYSPVFRWGISPNKLFDYLAMARPVIFGVDTPFNPIEKYHAGVSITPSDPKALAEAMIYLSKLPVAALTQMGLNGRAFVFEKHHIAKLTDRLETLLKEVTGLTSLDKDHVLETNLTNMKAVDKESVD